MSEINYKAIVESLSELYSDKFNDWESDFINAMMFKETFTDKMKEKIIQINRKYRARR